MPTMCSGRCAIGGGAAGGGWSASGKNGGGASSAGGSAVPGRPASSLAMLANLLALREQVIPAGTYVMTGGITEAAVARAGDHFAARFQALGSLSIRFT